MLGPIKAFWAGNMTQYDGEKRWRDSKPKNSSEEALKRAERRGRAGEIGECCLSSFSVCYDTVYNNC